MKSPGVALSAFEAEVASLRRDLIFPPNERATMIVQKDTSARTRKLGSSYPDHLAQQARSSRPRDDL